MSAHTIAESTAVGRAASPVAASGEYLTFRLGEQEYGIGILLVQEIRGYETPTRLAGAPAAVRGVLNLRGVIVPVVDLRTRFGIDAAFEAVTVTVVLNVGGHTVGAVVDAVADVVDLEQAQIRPAPEFCGGGSTGHVTGIGSICQGDRERMLILLDIERLMRDAGVGLCSNALAQTSR